jgi:3-oxoacyl-[acyl-carrier protein] reductase
MAKAAIVTGGSGGIGRAIAKRLAADGFHVVVGYSSGAAKASDVVAEIRSLDGQAMAIKCDVTDSEEVRLRRDFSGGEQCRHDAPVATSGPQ